VIDEGNHQPWPREVIDAVARFKQGDLVERPPLFYFATPRYGVWDFTRMQATDADQGGELFEVDPEDGPPFGLITTQTCDLTEQSPRPRQPWIKVAPVYEASGALPDEGRRNQARQHQIGHLVVLTNQTLPSGLWVADLRIEAPIEKSWLIGRDPVTGFETEAQYLKLAERLAGRSNRPALDNTVSNLVVRSLRAGFDKLSRLKKADIIGELQEVRLETNDPRMAITSARLMVITYDDPTPEAIRLWFDLWWDTAQEECRSAGIALIANHYTTLAKLSAADYVPAIPLDFDYLSPDD